MSTKPFSFLFCSEFSHPLSYHRRNGSLLKKHGRNAFIQHKRILSEALPIRVEHLASADIRWKRKSKSSILQGFCVSPSTPLKTSMALLSASEDTAAMWLPLLFARPTLKAFAPQKL
jgi:hypothetical protein